MRRMAAWVAMLPLAVVLGIAQSQATTPAVAAVRTVAARPVAQVPDDDRPLLIGDSIAHSVATQFLGRHPDFMVDAVPGRRIVTLPVRLRRHLASVGVPSVLVVEMGTNTVATWSKADYQAVVAMLPLSTRIVMVTPYVRKNHLAKSLPRGARAAARTREYAAWEYELARENANVCVDPWRAAVVRRPGLLTPMGVHPTPAGQRVFLRLLDTTLAGCRGSAVP